MVSCKDSLSDSKERYNGHFSAAAGGCTHIHTHARTHICMSWLSFVNYVIIRELLSEVCIDAADRKETFFLHQWSQVCFNQLNFVGFNSLWWLLLNLMLLLWLHRLHALSKLTFSNKQAMHKIHPTDLLPPTSAAFLRPHPKFSCHHHFNFFKPNVNHSEVKDALQSFLLFWPTVFIVQYRFPIMF